MELPLSWYGSVDELQGLAVEVRVDREVEQTHLQEQHDRTYQTWRTLMAQTNPDLDMAVREAVLQVFEGRTLSKFMLNHISNWTSFEYRTILAERGIRRLHNDYRVLINWMYEKIEEAEKERIVMQGNIEIVKQRLDEVKKQKIKELRASLEAKKHRLQKARDEVIKQQAYQVHLAKIESFNSCEEGEGLHMAQ